jgi:hypothetical protein
MHNLCTSHADKSGQDAKAPRNKVSVHEKWSIKMTTPIAILFFALSAASFGAVSPVYAQSTFTPPDGCTAYLSVQSRSCIVSHHWTCEADPEGVHWRIAMDSDGPFYLSMSDNEFRWLRNYNLRDGGTTTLIEPEEDPASLTDLLANGRDAMVYSTLTEERDGATLIRNYTGFDALTGETVVVDGHKLLRTDFLYEYDLGFGPRRVSGTQYVSEAWRLFFGGLETVTVADGGTFEADYSPMEFAEPGERGFLSMQPNYDCGDMMSALPQMGADLILVGYDHD